MSTVICKTYSIETQLEWAPQVLKELILFRQFETKKYKRTKLFTNEDEELLTLDGKLKKLNSIFDFYKKKLGREDYNLDDDFTLNVKDLHKLNKEKESLKILLDHIHSRLIKYNITNRRVKFLTRKLDKLNYVKSYDEPVLYDFDLFGNIFLKVNQEVATKLEDIFPKKLQGHLTIEEIQSDHTEEDEFIFIVAFPKQYEKRVAKFIKKLTNTSNNENYKIEKLNIQGYKEEVTPKKVYRAVLQELQQTAKERKRLRSSIISDIENNSYELLTLKQFVEIEKEVIENLESIKVYKQSINKIKNNKTIILPNTRLRTKYSTKAIVHIDGWMDASNKNELERRLKNLSSDINLIEINKGKKEQIENKEGFGERTVLKNSVLFKPFETITKVMGLPNSREVDPSPFLAPFFIAFFGFAIGDAGYGILMLMTSFFLLSIKKVEGLMKQFANLFIYFGISTTFFGIITASWFGAVLDEGTNSLTDFLLTFKLFDFQASVLEILLATLVVGFVQQSLGLILSIYSHSRRGKLIDGLAESGTWLLLLSSIVFVLLTNSVERLESLSAINTLLISISIILFVLGQGKKASKAYLIPLLGTAKLFNITSFFSNTLSYARLLPLGLATGVIASVVNLIAGTFASNSLGPSLIIYVLILVIGHIFNLGISLLGGGINVLRLHLVEFFPLFFTGEGEELQPIGNKIEKLYLSSNVNSSYLNRSIIG